MKKTDRIRVFGCLLLISNLFGSMAWTDRSWAAVTFIDALTKGKISMDLRYRYEFVDEDDEDDKIILKNAQASTLRTRLGYETENYSGFGALIEFENVAVIGSNRFNDTVNGRTEFPIVAEPPDTEINQAFLSYQPQVTTWVRYGRQRITIDNQRFVGNVGWQQNEQTFDALSIVTQALPQTQGTYVYLTNVNRVFGENHPTSSDLGMETHLINLALIGPEEGSLTGYAYLLDFDDTPLASTKTFGVRLQGSQKVNQKAKIIYTAEYADQSEYADGASSNDASYYLGELGWVFDTSTLKANYEVLGGDGIYGFSTPLATLHGFQGWTDQFLVTPSTGVRDLFFTLSVSFQAGNLTVVYHDFSSDHGGFNYGTELGVSLQKTYLKHYTFLVKYASYDAENTPSNTGNPSQDVEKLWLVAQIQF
ncbi:MAG TPA: alginate export family protein [Nitrospiria bacterium]